MNKKIIIFANTSKKNISSTLKRIESFITACGDTVRLLDFTSTHKDLDLIVPQSDLAVSLGGDGTALTAAMLLKEKDIPLLPVKVGSFGFITDTQATEFEEVYSLWSEGNAKTQKRMMLDVTVERDKKEVFSSSALNEFAIVTGYRAKIAHFCIYIDSVKAAEIKGDGIIIAGPTGSTAYNMSAGGPILDATLEGIIVNPICPFTMSIRPLVVNSEKEIKMEIIGTGEKLSIISDGHLNFDLAVKDVLSIKKSNFQTVLVENPNRNFIELLRDKLGWADKPN